MGRQRAMMPGDAPNDHDIEDGSHAEASRAAKQGKRKSTIDETERVHISDSEEEIQMTGTGTSKSTVNTGPAARTRNQQPVHFTAQSQARPQTKSPPVAAIPGQAFASSVPKGHQNLLENVSKELDGHYSQHSTPRASSSKGIAAPYKPGMNNGFTDNSRGGKSQGSRPSHAVFALPSFMDKSTLPNSTPEEFNFNDAADKSRRLSKNARLTTSHHFPAPGSSSKAVNEPSGTLIVKSSAPHLLPSGRLSLDKGKGKAKAEEPIDLSSDEDNQPSVKQTDDPVEDSDEDRRPQQSSTGRVKKLTEQYESKSQSKRAAGMKSSKANSLGVKPKGLSIRNAASRAAQSNTNSQKSIHEFALSKLFAGRYVYNILAQDLRVEKRLIIALVNNTVKFTIEGFGLILNNIKDISFQLEAIQDIKYPLPLNLTSWSENTPYELWILFKRANSIDTFMKHLDRDAWDDENEEKRTLRLILDDSNAAIISQLEESMKRLKVYSDNGNRFQLQAMDGNAFRAMSRCFDLEEELDETVLREHLQAQVGQRKPTRSVGGDSRRLVAGLLQGTGLIRRCSNQAKSNPDQTVNVVQSTPAAFYAAAEGGKPQRERRAIASIARTVDSPEPEPKRRQSKRLSTSTLPRVPSGPVDISSDGEVSVQPIDIIKPAPRNLTANPGPKDAVLLTFPYKVTGGVTITNGDMDRLEEGEFLNDTLIEYGMKRIFHKLQQRDPELAEQTHLFNSFFYKKLTQKPPKDPQKRKEFNAYQTIAKWTSKVDLFKKRFVVVPINENLHWYLAIICDPQFILHAPSPVAPRKVKSPSKGKRKSGRISGVGVEIDDAPDDTLATPSASSPLSGISDPVNHTKVDHQSRSTTPNVDDEDVEMTTQAVDNLQVEESKSDSLFNVPNSNFLDKFPDVVPNPRQLQEVHDSKVDSGTATEGDSDADTIQASLQPQTSQGNPNVCRIITFDSLGGSHRPVWKALKLYLKEEAMAKLKKTEEEIAPEDVQYEYAHVPQQIDFCNCGPHLLHFFEKFMEDPDAVIDRTFDKSIKKKRGNELPWKDENLIGRRNAMKADIHELKIEWRQWKDEQIKIEAKEKEERKARKQARLLAEAEANIKSSAQETLSRAGTDAEEVLTSRADAGADAEADADLSVSLPVTPSVPSPPSLMSPDGVPSRQVSPPIEIAESSSLPSARPVSKETQHQGSARPSGPIGANQGLFVSPQVRSPVSPQGLPEFLAAPRNFIRSPEVNRQWIENQSKRDFSNNMDIDKSMEMAHQPEITIQTNEVYGAAFADAEERFKKVEEASSAHLLFEDFKGIESDSDSDSEIVDMTTLGKQKTPRLNGADPDALTKVDKSKKRTSDVDPSSAPSPKKARYESLSRRAPHRQSLSPSRSIPPTSSQYPSKPTGSHTRFDDA